MAWRDNCCGWRKMGRVSCQSEAMTLANATRSDSGTEALAESSQAYGILVPNRIHFLKSSGNSRLKLHPGNARCNSSNPMAVVIVPERYNDCKLFIFARSLSPLSVTLVF